MLNDWADIKLVGSMAEASSAPVRTTKETFKRFVERASLVVDPVGSLVEAVDRMDPDALQSAMRMVESNVQLGYAVFAMSRQAARGAASHLEKPLADQEPVEVPVNTGNDDEAVVHSIQSLGNRFEEAVMALASAGERLDASSDLTMVEAWEDAHSAAMGLLALEHALIARTNTLASRLTEGRARPIPMPWSTDAEVVGFVQEIDEARKPKTRQQKARAIYRKFPVGNKMKRGGKLKVMLTGPVAKKMGMKEYASLSLDDITDADMDKLMVAVGIAESEDTIEVEFTESMVEAASRDGKLDVYVVAGNTKPRRLGRVFPTGWTRIKSKGDEVRVATSHKFPNKLRGTTIEKVGQVNQKDMLKLQVRHESEASEEEPEPVEEARGVDPVAALKQVAGKMRVSPKVAGSDLHSAFGGEVVLMRLSVARDGSLKAVDPKNPPRNTAGTILIQVNRDKGSMLIQQYSPGRRQQGQQRFNVGGSIGRIKKAIDSMVQDLISKLREDSEFVRDEDLVEAKVHAANSRYLSSIGKTTKDRILKLVAKHYGISTKEAEEELLDADAEAVYEYISFEPRFARQVYNDYKRKLKEDTDEETMAGAVGANIPRGFAAKVSRSGFDGRPKKGFGNPFDDDEEDDDTDEVDESAKTIDDLLRKLAKRGERGVTMRASGFPTEVLRGVQAHGYAEAERGVLYITRRGRKAAEGVK